MPIRVLKRPKIRCQYTLFHNVSSRTLEQVASLPVPLVPPCGGLRRAAELKVLVLVLWHAALTPNNSK